VSLDEIAKTQQVQLELGFQKEIYEAAKFINLDFIPKKNAP